jgi:hypothetical protein
MERELAEHAKRFDDIFCDLITELLQELAFKLASR